MSESSKSSYEVFVEVIEHHLLCAEVEATSEQEAAALVKEVAARFDRSRDGLQYMTTAGTLVVFHVQNCGLDDEAFVVTKCEPVAKEHSALSKGNADVVLVETEDDEPEALLLSDARESVR